MHRVGNKYRIPSRKGKDVEHDIKNDEDDKAIDLSGGGPIKMTREEAIYWVSMFQSTDHLGALPEAINALERASSVAHRLLSARPLSRWY
jgi:hypothetical protein